MKSQIIVLICLICNAVSLAGFEFSIRDFGATGDDSSKDTASIQAAIDACAKSGGGTVYFPSGRYVSGSIHLTSNVALHLDHGAVLMASPDDHDFDPYEELGFENDSDHETSFFHHALIWGQDLQHIAITGSGVIDGNRSKRGGPKPIALKRCLDVLIRDISIINSPNYCISLLGTDYVNIDGVRIENGYCDGIDPDCSSHVRISNCDIDCWDDAIVPKTSFSLGEVKATEYLTVSNCILSTNCNGFKLGTESRGDFKYITVSNCVIKGRKGKPATSGISLESVDGSHIDGVTLTNISMQDVRAPIFLRLGNRGRDQNEPTPGTLENVSISHIVATGADLACPIAGIPGSKIRNVSLQDIRISYQGKGTLEQARVMPEEKIPNYPSAKMFGEMPAWGVFCRHVAGLVLSQINLMVQEKDDRPVSFFEDVSDLQITAFNVDPNGVRSSQFKMIDVRDALISSCMPRCNVAPFLFVSGTKSRSIRLLNNDFSRIEEIYSMDGNYTKLPVVLD